MAVSPEASAAQVPDGDLLLQPTVSWPREMTVGRRHLVEVDLALVASDGAPAEWPLEQEEEYVYTCIPDGGGDFDMWAVHDASVVLHRFGGSYGPAKFIVTPREKTGDRLFWLTFVNHWGVPVSVRELPVQVRADAGQQDTSAELSAPVEVPAMPGEPDGDLAENLAADGETTLDIPHEDLLEPVPAAGSAGPGIPVPAFPDLDHRDQDHRETEEMLTGARPAADVAPSAAATAPDRRDDPRRAVELADWYNLAGLRRSRSGILHWTLVPLFSPGAASGDRVTFTARCAPSDEHGTIFAVLAAPGNGSDQEPQLRSVQSVKIPSGIYRVTAELLYPNPGEVRFHGLPASPREDLRRWPEIFATVPPRLSIGTGPVHLIAAIEISGPYDLVQERIECVRRLFARAAAEAQGFVCYSVITYGPHSINNRNRDYPEVPVTTLAWAEAADDALGVLARLARVRAVIPSGYTAAAQIECVLTDLDRHLTGQEGRPVIVTVGMRPAHPPRVDPITQIIPCPDRNDWTGPMRSLRTRYAGIAFGAIHESGRRDELWGLLGTDAEATLEDFSSLDFATALGLTARPAELIPLPMFSGQLISPGVPAQESGSG